MNVEKINNLLNGTLKAGSGDTEVTSFYAGDFLSRVIAGAPSNSCWLTIMNNINVVGVAVMADIKAIVICEGVQPMKELVSKCEEEGIALISTQLNVFDCAVTIAKSQ